MKTMKQENYKKAQRTRSCWNCGGTIVKGDMYLNREMRYDRKIITFSFCKDCCKLT
jgi:hypothetical protein